MSSIVVIGLCGEAGSGKSSVARHLCKQHGARPISFAEPLKYMAIDIWGFSEEQVFGEADIKEKADDRTGIVPRWAMKKLGQAARDHLGSTVWIDRVLAQLDTPGLYVIEDVRYLNEAQMITELGDTPYISMQGHVLRLHCADSVSTDDGIHPSEAEVNLIPPEHIRSDIYSSREKGLDHLFGEVWDVIKEIL